MKYEENIKQLEDIVKKIETGELGIDEIADKLKQAQLLIKVCKDKLTKTEAELAAIKAAAE